jgi:hypothetical protein
LQGKISNSTKGKLCEAIIDDILEDEIVSYCGVAAYQKDDGTVYFNCHYTNILEAETMFGTGTNIALQILESMADNNDRS